MPNFFNFHRGESRGQSRESLTVNSIISSGDLSTALASFDTSCNYSLDDGWLTAFEDFIGQDLDELINLVPDDLRRILNSSDDEEDDDFMSFSLAPAPPPNNLREHLIIRKIARPSDLSTSPQPSVQSEKTVTSKPSGLTKVLRVAALGRASTSSTPILDESARIPMPLPIPSASRPERNYEFQLAKMKVANLAVRPDSDRHSPERGEAVFANHKTMQTDVFDHIGKADVHTGTNSAGWQHWTPFHNKQLNKTDQRASESQNALKHATRDDNEKRTTIGKYKFHTSGDSATVHPITFAGVEGSNVAKEREPKNKLEVNTSRPLHILEQIATPDAVVSNIETPETTNTPTEENKRISIGRYKFHSSLPSPVRTSLAINERIVALSPLRSPNSEYSPHGSPLAHRKKSRMVSEAFVGVTRAVRLPTFTGLCNGSDDSEITVELYPLAGEISFPTEQVDDCVEATIAAKKKSGQLKAKKTPYTSDRMADSSDVKLTFSVAEELSEVAAQALVPLKSTDPCVSSSKIDVDNSAHSIARGENFENYRPIRIRAVGHSKKDSVLEGMKSPDSNAALAGDLQQEPLAARDNNLTSRPTAEASKMEDEKSKSVVPRDATPSTSSVKDTKENQLETINNLERTKNPKSECKPESVPNEMAVSESSSSKESTVALKIRSLTGSDGVEIQRGLSPGYFCVRAQAAANERISLYDSEGNRLETQLVPENHLMNQFEGVEKTLDSHMAYNQQQRTIAVKRQAKSRWRVGDKPNTQETTKAVRFNGPDNTNQDHHKAKHAFRMPFLHQIKQGSQRLKAFSHIWKKSDFEHDAPELETPGQNENFINAPSIQLHSIVRTSEDCGVTSKAAMSAEPNSASSNVPLALVPVTAGLSAGKGLKSFLVSPFHRVTAKRQQPILETIQERTSDDAVNGSEAGSKPSIDKLSIVALKPPISPVFAFNEVNNNCNGNAAQWPVRQYTIGVETALSPVVLYPILDYNPCRPELLLEVDIRDYLQSHAAEGLEVVPTLRPPPIPQITAVPKASPPRTSVGCCRASPSNTSPVWSTDNTGCKCMIQSSSSQTASSSDGSHESKEHQRPYNHESMMGGNPGTGLVNHQSKSQEGDNAQAEARETNIECQLGTDPTTGSVPPVDGRDDDVSTRVAGSSNTRVRRGVPHVPVGHITVREPKLQPKELISAINTIQRSRKQKKSRGLSKDEMKIARRLYTDLKILSKIEKKMKKLSEEGDSKNDETMTVLNMMDKMVKRKLKKELQKQRLIADKEDAATESTSDTLTALGLSTN